jgi:hypothetical protein
MNFGFQDVAVVLGDDIGIMIRAFSATLEDKHVLVQRAILDLLVTSFPLKVKNDGEYVFYIYLTLSKLSHNNLFRFI